MCVLQTTLTLVNQPTSGKATNKVQIIKYPQTSYNSNTLNTKWPKL